MENSLTEKTLSGINWQMLNNYTNSIVTIIVGIVLARLLTPREFGLIGMVVIFTGLADLFATLGMAKAVIKLNNLNEDHIRVATTVTIILSILVFFIFYFSSYLIADFYKEPKLVNIIKVLALLFIIKGVNTVSYGQLQKALDFKTVMVINISSSIMYGVASSFLAIIGFGVWSLVLGQIASTLMASYITLRKYPLNLKPLFKMKEFKELAGFGSGVSLSSMLLYGSSNVDYLIVGKFLNPYALGLYTKAFNLMTESINKVTGGVYSVLFPAFAAAQDDKSKLRRAFLRTTKTITFFLFPILGFMIIDADYIVKGLYGIKWADMIPAFRILAFGGLLRTTLSFSAALVQATGRVYMEAFQRLIFFLLLGGTALFTIRYGIEGVAFAVLVAVVWMFFALSWLVLKIIESSWKEFFISFIPGFVNLVLVVFINLILILLLEKYFSYFFYEIKLITALIINAFSFLSIFVFLPYSIKGDTFDWLMEKYKRFIPGFFSKIYFSFNNRDKVSISSLK